MGIISNIKNHKVIWAVSLLLSAVIITAGIIFYFTMGQNLLRDPNVLAVVGGKNITKIDLNEQIYGQDFKGSVENPPETSIEKKKELLGRLIEWKVCEIEAEKREIKATDEEVLKEVKIRIPNFNEKSSLLGGETDQDRIVKKTVKNELIKAKVKDKVLGSKEGEYIVIHFERYLFVKESLSKEEKAKTLASQESKALEDRQYAEQLANKLYQDIKSKKITFEEAMEQAKNDPRTGEPAFTSLGLNVVLPGKFTKEDYINNSGLFSYVGVKDKVSKTKNGEISEPFIAKVAVVTDEDKEKSETKDGLYFIVKPTSGDGGETSNYEEWLNNKKKDLNTTIYDESLALNEENTNKKSLISTANAHYGGHGCTQPDHWGIASGNPYAPGGVVIRTYYYEANGAGPYDFNVGLHIRSDCHQPSEYGCSGILYRPNAEGPYAIWQDIDLGTGSVYYFDGVGGPACANGGYLVLGYGYTSPSGLYGHHGNGWTLNCNQIYTLSFGNGPGNGYWLGGNPRGGLKTANGATVWWGFHWQKTGYNPEGWLDGANCTQASGWALDRDNPNQSIQVHLYATTNYSADPWYGAARNEKYLGSVTANQPRPDVNAALGVSGNHGYTFTIPNELKTGTPWYIYAYGINIGGGNNMPLSGSPKAITCNSASLACTLTARPAEGVEPLTATLTANPVPTNIPSPVYSYAWTFGDGQSATGTQTQNHTYIMTQAEKTAQQVVSRNASVTITEGSKSVSCSANITLRIRPWAESNWLEVAP